VLAAALYPQEDSWYYTKTTKYTAVCGSLDVNKKGPPPPPKSIMLTQYMKW
jgi:hypothetical protein